MVEQPEREVASPRIHNSFIQQEALPEVHPLPLGEASSGTTGLQEPWGSPHPRGAAPPPLQGSRLRQARQPSHSPLCSALNASPPTVLSLGVITCEFLVTDAVRFRDPGGTGRWASPLPPSSPCLAPFLRLSTSKWLLK